MSEILKVEDIQLNEGQPWRVATSADKKYPLYMSILIFFFDNMSILILVLGFLVDIEI